MKGSELAMLKGSPIPLRKDFTHTQTDDEKAFWRGETFDRSRLERLVKSMGKQLDCEIENFHVTNAAYVKQDKELSTLRQSHDELRGELASHQRMAAGGVWIPQDEYCDLLKSHGELENALTKIVDDLQAELTTLKEQNEKLVRRLNESVKLLENEYGTDNWRVEESKELLASIQKEKVDQ